MSDTPLDSEQGDTDDHTVDPELLELYEALEAHQAGLL